MTCKDCIYYDRCYLIEHYAADENEADVCKDFKNKADFVEVVRCSECKHWSNGMCWGIPFCGDDASYIEAEEVDFCSNGERKDT